MSSGAYKEFGAQFICFLEPVFHQQSTEAPSLELWENCEVDVNFTNTQLLNGCGPQKVLYTVASFFLLQVSLQSFPDFRGQTSCAVQKLIQRLRT